MTTADSNSNSSSNDPTPLKDAFAVYVHKLLAERVKVHLFQEALEWKISSASATSSDSGSPAATSASRKRPLPTCSYEILSSEEIKGVSKLRRGYHLVLLTGVTGSVSSISPMARKNISWASRVDFRMKTSEAEGTAILKTIVSNFDITKDLLRVDVYPRSETERICLALQQAAGSTDTNPFEGPILMTKSATNCTHRTVVIIDKGTIYWGTMDKSVTSDKDLMMTKFNHQATEEVLFQASDSKTGADIGPTVDATLPLSRAYYKLEQVWDDVLAHANIPLLSGLDLGACPGGWTQVLVHLAKLSRVVAVDPGRLADRVLALPQVTFVGHALQSKEAATTICNLGKDMLYSHVVCDASLILDNVFDKVVGELLQALPEKNIFALPSCWVITIKLPFKTQHSLARHIARAKEWAPVKLEEIKNLVYPFRKVTVRYTFAHLMANADSERTLIAIMEEEDAPKVS